MLLSECIRLGAMLGPQLRKNLIDGSGASCAIGSAMLAGSLVATGENSKTMKIERLLQVHQALDAMFPGLKYETREEIVFRNNQSRHTREEIADWLVESGNDCASVEITPAQDLAAALVSAHMVAK